jgi:hypothetical protein
MLENNTFGMCEENQTHLGSKKKIRLILGLLSWIQTLLGKKKTIGEH